MNKLGILLLSAACATALAVGCGGEDPDTTTTTTTSTSGSTSSSGSSSGMSSSSSSGGDLGMMPTYAAQVDRFGRPAINTALNHTFDPMAMSKGMAKDMWNKNGDPTKWGADHMAEVSKNLAILDGLDANCGNQLLADKTKMDNAGRYGGLAAALTDDRQWLNTDGATCTTYLAVEANATGIIPNMDCGGRHLNYDVVDVSYSALAIGAVMGVDDGIPVPSHATGKTFPYLAAPTP